MNRKLPLNRNLLCMYLVIKGEKLPAHAIKGFENLEKVFADEIKKAKTNQRYKIGLIDLMLLKRQKLGAITLTGRIKSGWSRSGYGWTRYTAYI